MLSNTAGLLTTSYLLEGHEFSFPRLLVDFMTKAYWSVAVVSCSDMHKRALLVLLENAIMA